MNKNYLSKINSDELSFVEKILQENHLVTHGVFSDNVIFYWFISDEKKVGFAAFEERGKSALLRSMVIFNEYRNQNFGSKFCSLLIDKAKEMNFKNIYLLTTTAKDFFLKQNFKLTQRNFAPPEIQESEQFKSICPETAACLYLDL